MNPGDLFNVMGNPALMSRFEDLQRLLKMRTFTVTSGNNLVRITFNYQQEVIDIHFDNRLLDPARAGTLKASLVEAINRGVQEARLHMIEEAQRLFMNP